MKTERLASRHIVLIGLGHTNAHILRMWAMDPLPDTDLTCISDRPFATYSGMLPAVLAGQLAESDMQIDLVRLSASCGARFIVDSVSGIDREQHRVLLRNHPPVAYHAMSIGIGSVPTMASVQLVGKDDQSRALLKIKPMQTFLPRLERRLDDLRKAGEKLRIAVVGSGVAGIEIAFCLHRRLQQQQLIADRWCLISRSQQILSGEASGTRKRIQSELLRRGYDFVLGKSVVEIGDDHLQMDDGTRLDANLIIWATGASPPATLSTLGLPVDERGFLATDQCLRVPDPGGVDEGRLIFAVGDTGTMLEEAVPKAGVYAVRQGPILWDNLQATLDDDPLREYRPQGDFLRLINLGDGRAVGQWKGMSFCGRWVYQLKNWIDSQFMKKFEPQSMMDESQPMQCRGCGCKLPASLLNQVVDGFSQSTDIVLDDAASIGADGGQKWLASTDFFTSPFSDAFTFGRVAALHSASDLIAMGASVDQALANVVIPEGDPTSQQSELQDFLAGAAFEFEGLGTKIVGGHTITGPRMEAGFTVIGAAAEQGTLNKDGLRPGDLLFLTKPLGIGVLLAAHMRARCSHESYDLLLQTMFAEQRAYAVTAVEAGIQAATDITGFGLAGHLLEMLDAAKVQAEIDLNAIPLLKGAERLAGEGIESSLLPGNLSIGSRVLARDEVKDSPKYRLLFDPQTCGGLLFGVPPECVHPWLSLLPAKVPPPKQIGVVNRLDPGAAVTIAIPS